ncbi:MAG TPA: alpha-glucosidase C-terminal domain-containing protein, partial [Gemmatimonadales bacterium]|nr:alpha-glucosidase C-terminal domain-containing protein [Gemmatimonadales bacterium]
HLRLFVDGTLNWIVTDDADSLLAYERVLGNERAIVAFNASDAPHELSVSAEGRYRLAWPVGGGVTTPGGTLKAQLPARSARVWIRE